MPTHGRAAATSGRAAACLPSVPVAHRRRQAPLRFWGQLHQLERRHEDFNKGGHTFPDSTPYPTRVRAQSGSSGRPLALDAAVLKAHLVTPLATQGGPKR